MKLPEGWPTEEMIKAAGSVQLIGFVDWDYLRAVVTAALAAAPTPPAPDMVRTGEVLVTVSGFTGSGKSAIAGEIEILCRALGLQVEWIDSASEKNVTHADWTGALEQYKPRVRIVERNIPISTPSAQDSEDVIKKLMEQAQVFASAWALVGWPFDSGEALADAESAKEELEEMLRQSITPPAQEDEPVYQHRAGWYGDDVWVDIGDLRYEALKANDVQVRKLYTRPDDKLRKAAEELLQWYDRKASGNSSDVEILMQNLRAALEK